MAALALLPHNAFLMLALPLRPMAFVYPNVMSMAKVMVSMKMDVSALRTKSASRTCANPMHALTTAQAQHQELNLIEMDASAKVALIACQETVPLAYVNHHAHNQLLSGFILIPVSALKIRSVLQIYAITYSVLHLAL